MINFIFKNRVMDITKELKDDLNAVLKVQIGKSDYGDKVEKVLGDYRKKARIDGFRPGKVPAGLIQKLYGKTVMVEEINKLLSESVMKYIHDEHIHILGDPLPSEKEQKEIDLHRSNVFETLQIKTMRFKNDEVINNIHKVLEKITSVLKSKSLSYLSLSLWERFDPPVTEKSHRVRTVF